MKHSYYKSILKVLFCIIVLAMALYACRKKYIEPIQSILSDNIGSTEQIDFSSIVGKIKNFKNRMSIADGLASKSEDFISIDSVVWNIEALFNASYTFPDLLYDKIVTQELVFSVPVNNNVVSMSDVALLYDQIINDVRTAYSNDGIVQNKSLKNVFFEKGEVENNRLEIIALVSSGRSIPEDPGNLNVYYVGPFGEDDCWYFGEYGGSCDDPSEWGDAAEWIEYWINYYYGWSPAAVDGYRNIYFSQSMIHLLGNEYVKYNGEYYIYYWINNLQYLYLSGSLLNYYFQNEVDVIMELVPNDPKYSGQLPQNPKFMEVDIQGNSSIVSGGTLRRHENFILYGEKIAIPVLDLGLPVDLLQK